MNAAQYPFGKIHYLFWKADHARWHRLESKRHILRSQFGFPPEISSGQPPACQGCANYHGIAYGYQPDTRSVLVCGFHPQGWLGDLPCPDWWDGRER